MGKRTQMSQNTWCYLILMLQPTDTTFYVPVPEIEKRDIKMCKKDAVLMNGTCWDASAICHYGKREVDEKVMTTIYL